MKIRAHQHGFNDRVDNKDSVDRNDQINHNKINIKKKAGQIVHKKTKNLIGSTKNDQVGDLMNFNETIDV